ncbi:MAG TPA: GNAT family N-acetyltransferase [Candidatus Nanopelagicales bacterium]|nr:GNAT family N-acetyltransferase [Candidatus Nanopelagicales bacterium]
MDPENKAHVDIQIVDRTNFEQVLPLIAAYQRYYKMTPDEERNRSFFQRIIDDSTQGVMFVAFDRSGEPVGFATLYFIPSSLSAAMSCTFNDLYTTPAVRGQGVGVVLGLHCLVHARDLGYKKMTWLTLPSNKVAQQIYDYTNATRTEWYSYDLNLEFS